MELTIGHLYPDLLNLYGDRGNIITLQSRLERRNIKAAVQTFELADDIDFSQLDIVFIGGGSDREQQLVCNRLCEQKQAIQSYVEQNGVMLAVCGGYQLLGNYYRLKNELIRGLGILDIRTEQEDGRLIGNVVLQSDCIGQTIVGFENHGGRTDIGSHTPLGTVLYGHGNDGKSGAEGVVYKNVIGTYLHGPLLPKNPALADHILQNALDKKYGAATLPPLDDALEQQAHDYIVTTYLPRNK